MAITGFQKIFEVDGKEYAYAYEEFKLVSDGQLIPLVIPKLMGSLNGKGKDTLSADGKFENDNSCKPSVASSVTREEKLMVPISINDTLGYDIDRVIYTGFGQVRFNVESTVTIQPITVPKGTEFIVQFVNGDITRPYTRVPTEIKNEMRIDMHEVLRDNSGTD